MMMMLELKDAETGRGRHSDNPKNSGTMNCDCVQTYKQVPKA